MSGLHRCLQRPEREWHAEVRGTAGKVGRKSVKVGAATAGPQGRSSRAALAELTNP